MKYHEALEIAARIWGDRYMEEKIMDITLCEEIAALLYDNYKDQKDPS